MVCEYFGSVGSETYNTDILTTNPANCSTLVSTDESILPENIKIFPNPAHDYILIENNESNDLMLIVYDQLGKIVIPEKRLYNGINRIDISYLEKGIYAFEVYSSKGIIQNKIVIE